MNKKITVASCPAFKQKINQAGNELWNKQFFLDRATSIQWERFDEDFW